MSRLTNNKTVFVAPDRSTEDRAKQRTFVSELKREKIDEPNKRHFVRGGTVVTVSVETTTK